MKKAAVLILVALIQLGCTVSYKFNGANIDYSVIKTVNIVDFQNQALRVYPPLAQKFNERMKDVFVQNTKLTLTDVNPDWEIEGEIVRYDLAPLSVKEDALASETRLTMAVRYRFKNNKSPSEDKDNQEISAYRDFNANKRLDEVEDDLTTQLTKEIVDQIFNAIASDWSK